MVFLFVPERQDDNQQDDANEREEDPMKMTPTVLNSFCFYAGLLSPDGMFVSPLQGGDGFVQVMIKNEGGEGFVQVMIKSEGNDQLCTAPTGKWLGVRANPKEDGGIQINSFLRGNE